MKILYVIAAVYAVCMVLVTSSSLGSNNAHEELKELIEKLRENLEEEEQFQVADAKSEVRTLHDDAKVVRYRGMKTIGVRVKESQRSGPGLTSAQQTELVNAINTARRNEGANDMYFIRWNNKLAELAQQWSDQCVFGHGHPLFEAAEVGFNDVGQNNFASKDPFNAATVVNDWIKEKPDYNTATNECKRGRSCDRYRQLVWGATTDVGCGLTECDRIDSIGEGNFLVCYFGPPGMYEGEKPYIPGSAPCSQCSEGQFYCNNGLCDATCSKPGPTCECKANCKNCATTVSDCSCQCKPGSIGVDCSQRCGNFNPQCGTDWPKYFCDLNLDFVLKQCPKMCKKCVEADPCAAGRKQSNSWSDYKRGLYHHLGVIEE